MVMWLGSDTRPRDWSRVLVKSFYYVGTNNRISTSGTCKFVLEIKTQINNETMRTISSGIKEMFACDGPRPSYAIRFAFGMLPLLIYETILCFPILWKAIQNYGNGYRSSFLSEMVHDRYIRLTIVLSEGISSPFSVLTSPSTVALGYVHHIAELLKSSHDTTVTPITFTINELPAHQREVKITTVTPALDEVYRFHTVIREQIGE
ncbi:hypothetical protein BU17DRAFT_60044 [Hysterangium stoloniferum]|nr:hypothetical protein BU17DRAFT_60044 [Hysterangium stoloniferum]